MTYILYVNTYATMVRNCLKEPHKTKALSQEQVYYKLQTYQEGDPLLKNLVPDLALFLALDQ
jgi:F-type H+-transporting ATPase subunit epsilon